MWALLSSKQEPRWPLLLSRQSPQASQDFRIRIFEKDGTCFTETSLTVNRSLFFDQTWVGIPTIFCSIFCCVKICQISCVVCTVQSEARGAVSWSQETMTNLSRERIICEVAHISKLLKNWKLFCQQLLSRYLGSRDFLKTISQIACSIQRIQGSGLQETDRALPVMRLRITADLFTNEGVENWRQLKSKVEMGK